MGARPQFVKASPVSRAFADFGIKEVIIHTGQHFDQRMSDIFFDELSIPTPAYNLGINGGPHGNMTGKMLIEIETLLARIQPEILLVYGDTNSTLAGALAAAKLNIKIGHVEAGLRSFNMQMPEEINRVLTDRVSTVLFTPSQKAVQNLYNEGFEASKIEQVGDVMNDMAIEFAPVAKEKSSVLKKLNMSDKNYILFTVHRAENTDNPELINNILHAIEKLAKETEIIWPLHPRARDIITRHYPWVFEVEGLHLTEPFGFIDMIAVEKSASIIVTDSGGVQKEAYFHRIPCVTLRGETEWVELVQTGWNVLCSPSNSEDIVNVIRNRQGSFGKDVSLYGQGKSAQKIVEKMSELL